MQKFPVINGLRGIAIIIVVYYHITKGGMLPDADFFHVGHVPFFPLTLLSNGQIAVGLFFVLSGFVLTLPYASGSRSMLTLQDASDFYLRRAKRLLPLYYLNVIFVAIFMHPRLELAPLFQDTFLMGTLAFHFSKNSWFPWYNGVLWSIAVEVWFGVLFPFLLYLIRKIGLWNVVCGAVILSTILHYVSIPASGLGLNAIGDSVFGRLDNLVAGMALAYVFASGKLLLKGWNIFLGIVLIMIACMGFDAERLGLIHILIGPAFFEILYLGFFFVVLGLLRSRGFFTHYFLANRPLQLIGMMSYSIYIWHTLAVTQLAPDYHLGNLLRYFFLLGILCWLSYRYIEFGFVRDIGQLLPRTLPKNQP